MAEYNNMATLFDNEMEVFSTNKSDVRLLLLPTFTGLNYCFRKVLNRIPLIPMLTSVKNDGKNYIFKCKDKEYKFSIFSEQDIQTSDRKRLKNIKERNMFSLARSLKLACSMDLVDPKIVLGKSTWSNLELFISYYTNEGEKVIDYARNIIMDKVDYYDMLSIEEYNTLDKYDLYRIYVFFGDLGDEVYDNIFEYLIFSKEIFAELGKNVPRLVEKYDFNGVNKRNYIIFGDSADRLYAQEEDCLTSKFQDIRDELDEFTLNPTIDSKHIKPIEGEKKYIFEEKSFGYFEFSLLSDFLISDRKNELLTEERYGKCHNNSVVIANGVSKNDRPYTYVVGGRVKVGEVDTRDHSWVEIDDGEKAVVMDYNHNLIMNRDKYYKLYEIEVVEKTQIDELVNIFHQFDDAGLNLHNKTLIYLGNELSRDLKKNEKIFQKK